MENMTPPASSKKEPYRGVESANFTGSVEGGGGGGGGHEIEQYQKQR